MKIIKQIAAVILPLALLIPSIASAAVVYPALDIQLFGDDAGAYLTETDSGYDFDIKATAFAIINGDGTSTDIANQAFTLHGTFDGDTSTFFGTFNVAGSLLSGTFNDLTIASLGNSWDFEANLIFDDGSLNTSSGIGRLEGIGSTTNLSAKLGEITTVPVPAAAWLFGTGLIGLVGVARRKA